MIELAQALFEESYGAPPHVVVRAPGRVNLIGDHTDYNDGFVLPMAIERAVWMAVGRRSDRLVQVTSQTLGRASFDLDALRRQGSFVDYLSGVAWALGPVQLRGLDIAVVSDVPVGAGLSSSAALGVATALAFAIMAERDWQPEVAARAIQRAENEWVGVTSGIMDQLISAVAESEHATLIDCRSLVTEAVPMPAGLDVVILDSSTRRQLTTSLYNERRQTCERVATALGVRKLRDASLEMLDASPDLDPVDRMRARHVVTENARTVAAAAVLRKRQPEQFGALMNESHASLRHDFEVSTPALDALVEAAQDTTGCLGARLTGAGMGGCGVALVRSEALTDFRTTVEERYSATGLRAELYISRPASGADVAWRS